MLKLRLYIAQSTLLVSLFVFSIAHAAYSELLTSATEMVAKGKNQAAYELLMQSFEQNVGDPEYDYLLGVAALDSGHPTQAIFAFERVLDIEPDHQLARADLARAYYQSGEREAAKQEFQSLKVSDLSEGMEQVVDRFLSAIEQGYGVSQSRFSAYIQASGGYDSNVNGATSENTVAIPALGNLIFTLNQDNQETDSAVGSIEGGFEMETQILRPNMHLIAGASIEQRSPIKHADFRSRTLNANVGMKYASGKSQYLLLGQGQRYQFAGETNRNLLGATGQWRYSLTDNTQLTAFTQWAALRYPEQEVRNANSISGGFGFAHSFAGSLSPVMFGSVFGGKERELEQSRPDLGRDYAGARMGGQILLTPEISSFASLNYQYSIYSGNDPLFFIRRKDQVYGVNAGINYQPIKGLVVTPSLNYSRNESTIDINQYERWQAFITLRKNL